MSLDDLEAIREAARTSTRVKQTKTYGEDTPSDFEEDDEEVDEYGDDAKVAKTDKRKKSTGMIVSVLYIRLLSTQSRIYTPSSNRGSRYRCCLGSSSTR
jgi:hypothetical protein